jgi:AraC-like DNA-binding protein
MARTPIFWSVRPEMKKIGDERVDVLTDVLDSLRMRSNVFGRMELTAPWGLRVDFGTQGHPSFYVVSRGMCWLELDGVAEPIPLAAGDFVLLPKGRPNVLRDQPGSPTIALQNLLAGGTTAAVDGGVSPVLRHGGGGGGAPTTLVSGCFTFEGEAGTPLIDALPNLIHVKGEEGSPVRWLESTLQFLSAEAASAGPGAETIRNRLADILFVQAVRAHIAAAGAGSAGWLRALGDVQIGRALRLIHERPANPWTVESLAEGAAMSRSAFADRFRELVGVPPHSYVTRWRMHKASVLLRRGDKTIADVARAVGYENESSFGKVFKRFTGNAPGEFRMKSNGVVLEHGPER